MGAVADAALAARGRVIGVIPRDLFEREHLHEGITEVRAVDGMLERKALMAELSDGFISLPRRYRNHGRAVRDVDVDPSSGSTASRRCCSQCRGLLRLVESNFWT